MANAHRPPQWRTSLLFLSTILLSYAPRLASAASFTFALSTPIQCDNLTVTVSGGVPPYQLIIIPSGTQSPEYRRIISQNLTQGTNTMSFKLAYNTGSQFVALMSDATGFGTGGTGTATTVSASDDKSCLTETSAPEFFFYMTPTGYLSQCETTQLGWSTSAPNAAQGAVTIYGIIPGGQSFIIKPPSQPYNWNVPVRGGTSVTLFAGDTRGPGAGGSAGPFVVNGTDSSCINDSSPSSTAGSPAGAVTGSPASSSSSSSSGGSSSTKSGTSSTTGSPSSTSSSGSGGGGGSSHTGAIVGGVVGGVVGLAVITGLLFFFFCVKRRRGQSDESPANRRTVDLAGDDEDPGTPPSRSGPPMIESGFYHPEPFVVPEVGSSRPSTDIGHGTRTHAGSSMDLVSAGAASSAGGRPEQQRERRISQQTLSSSDPSSALTPTSRGRGGGGKSHPPSAMRATNFVQHEDAGAGALDPTAPPPTANQEEVVELPPTYSTVRPKKAKIARAANAEGDDGATTEGV